ncbi:CrcB family protein [Terrabacter sp. NPDC080008]|uniref:CrcB family protein n=1 Tax=Terrabacter sp. NPDC080008 TaxID=3155176 RepID=UPI00344D5CAE
MGVTDEPHGAAATTPARAGAPHRHPGLLVLIFLGGALGTSARAALEDAAPAQPAGVPSTTLAINVVGSLLLGALLEVLARTGPDAGWRRAARLTLGTGLLGGFTTYSTFAVETVQRLSPDTYAVGLVYALVSIALGIAAAAGGYVLARRLTGLRSRQRSRAAEPRR